VLFFYQNGAALRRLDLRIARCDSQSCAGTIVSAGILFMQLTSRCRPKGLRASFQLSARGSLALAAGALLGIVLSGGCPSDSSATGAANGNDVGGAGSVAGEVVVANSTDANGETSGNSNENVDSGSAGAGESTETDAPTARSTAATLLAGESAQITLEAEAGADQALEFQIVATPVVGELGALQRLGERSARISYSAPSDFAGEARFSFRAVADKEASAAATVTLAVLPRVRYSVTPTDGRRDLMIQARAIRAGGELPAGAYEWVFDDAAVAGDATDSVLLEHVFSIGGEHHVRLRAALAGLTSGFDATNAATNATETIVTVWPRLNGVITDANGSPLSGVTVSADGLADVATTDTLGNYRIDVPMHWSGQLRPELNGTVFDPPRRGVEPATLDRGGLDFTGGAPIDAIYVDNQIGSTSCATYNPTTRSCGAGSERAYRTLAGAAAAVLPGQTVYIRAGTFSEPLVPQRSGLDGQTITYRPLGNESVIITGGSLAPAIDLSGRSFITIEGLTISNVQRWLLAVNAHRNILRNNTFSHAQDPFGSSKTGIFFEAATYNRILDNVIDDSTQDNLVLVQSDRNLVQGNTITRAAHTLWAIKCGNYNIIRDNYFYNELQKIGEAYDCDGVGANHDINAQDATRYNVIEGNAFNYTPSSGDHSAFAAIQYAAQYGILRRNVFYDTTGPALSMTLYDVEAEYNRSNRVYHNVFHRTDFAGVTCPGAGYNWSDNVFKNNILVRSQFVRNDTRWNWYVELNGKPVQIMIGRLDGIRFERNNIFHTQAGQTYTITYGSRDSSSNPPQHDVAWWQSNQPAVFAGNIELEPRFVDENAHDYRLRSDSPMIDAAAFLTRTAAAGSGTSLRVEDAGYFCDGYGIPGEPGDLIQLQGQIATARVIAVDRATNTLTLSSTLTWSAGQGVALRYAGASPDLGAFEFE
jgi:parallel beta-helix repeat protein